MELPLDCSGANARNTGHINSLRWFAVLRRPTFSQLRWKVPTFLSCCQEMRISEYESS
jgi:hypothetical protein